MVRDFRRSWQLGLVALLAPALTSSALGASAPTAQQALSVRPVQRDVEFDTPAAAEMEKCNVGAEKEGKQSGWVVTDANGQVLRRFNDTNGDNTVDEWCYYANGAEVYRDIDSNFNGKADQYRWLNLGGSRWGFDKNEDGQIDAWKQISAEEVTAEVVRALATGDVKRFQLVLITPEELKQLGLADEIGKRMGEMNSTATERFSKLAKLQKSVSDKTEWVQFGATRPGQVPAGENTAQHDMLVYENVVAIIETEGKNDQFPIGTLIRVGDNWRVVDVPPVGGDTALADSGIFFQPAPLVPQVGGDARAPDSKTQKVLAQLDELEKAATNSASPDEMAKYNKQRADLIEELANDAASEEDRQQWLRQLADTVSAAMLSGTYPDGMQRLNGLYERLAKDGKNEELTAYVKFRVITGEYTLSLQGESPDFLKIQEQWLKDLETYVTAYPQSPDTAEALLQLGIAQEFAGQEEDAMKWYGQLVSNFPKAPGAAKADGARRRLESVGKLIDIQGNTNDGKRASLGQYRGKVVLVQYWATHCEPCRADLARLKELYAVYGNSGLAILGVALDSDKAAVETYLKSTRVPWQQRYEPEGLDGRLANEMGILTLPTMLLVDQSGKVVNRNIHITELDGELQKRLTQRSASASEDDTRKR
ncbi:MAG: thioredoxin-like domain-containing protein [Pirellulales bacterium]